MNMLVFPFVQVVVVPPRVNYPTTVSLVEGMALRLVHMLYAIHFILSVGADGVLLNPWLWNTFCNITSTWFMSELLRLPMCLSFVCCLRIGIEWHNYRRNHFRMQTYHCGGVIAGIMRCMFRRIRLLDTRCYAAIAIILAEITHATCSLLTTR